MFEQAKEGLGCDVQQTQWKGGRSVAQKSLVVALLSLASRVF